ncbi:hypothetical protein [Pyramidobacter sp.]|uniref:hypothetical protein n=1 Tax=Pyramidobacter sp. TaxID=1943581 RepID=UPI00258429CC|nr:hypothetical protein [Pyramidobacter sp.]MCI7403297.1 hypothetical protein [Pyramidobacter sp.]MDY3213387.1 hypothetical protein [Pyramidobacter sp.]
MVLKISDARTRYKHLSFSLIASFLKENLWSIDESSRGHELLRYVSPLSSRRAWIYIPSDPPAGFEKASQYADEYHDMLDEILSVLCQYYDKHVDTILDNIFRLEGHYDYIRVHLQSNDSIGSIPLNCFDTFMSLIRSLISFTAYQEKYPQSARQPNVNTQNKLLNNYSMCQTFKGSFGIQIAVKNELEHATNSQLINKVLLPEHPLERRTIERLLIGLDNIEKQDIANITNSLESLSEQAYEALDQMISLMPSKEKIRWDFDLINSIPLAPRVKTIATAPVFLRSESHKILQVAVKHFKSLRNKKTTTQRITFTGYVVALKKNRPGEDKRKFSITVESRDKKHDTVNVSLNEAQYAEMRNAYDQDYPVTISGIDVNQGTNRGKLITSPDSIKVHK